MIANGHTRILGPDGLPWFESDPRGGPESSLPIPHVYNFASMLGTAWKTYFHTRFDEALRAGRTEVTAMKRDAFLMGIFFERRHKVLSQKLSIEIEDERDPWQKAVKAGLMQIIRHTPRFRKLMKAIYWGVWDGRAASQVSYEWKTMEMADGNQKGMSTPMGPPISSSGTGRSKRRVLMIRQHQPINGDKITHHYDGTPVVMINRARAFEIPNVTEKDIVNTEEGAGLLLRGTWRNRFIIHSHEWMDADFFDVDEAEAIHGVGIRHFVYWLNTLRLEWLSNVADWCERTGLGVRLWYYQGGNKSSRDAVEAAALAQSDRTNILVPRFGERAVEGVDYIDTASNGADLLLRLQQHLEDIEERFIIGQTLSAHTEGHGLGGSGVAGMHEETKFNIINDDALDIDETLQDDWLKMVLRWTYPEHKDMPFRLLPNFGQTSATETLNAMKTFVDMGGKVRMEDARAAIGVPAPEEGDEVLERQEITMPGAGGMPGMDGMDGMDGLDDLGEVGPEEQEAMDELFGGTEESDEPSQFIKEGQPARYAYDPQKHQHKPKGPGGGQFAPGSGGRGLGATPANGKPQQKKQGKQKAMFGGSVESHASKFAHALESAVRSGDQQKAAEIREKASTGFKRVLAHRYLEMKDRAVSTWGEQILSSHKWLQFKSMLSGYAEDFNDQLDAIQQGESDASFVGKMFAKRADRMNDYHLDMHADFGKQFAPTKQGPASMLKAAQAEHAGGSNA